MPEPLIRGHVIMHTANFLRTQCDRATHQRLEASLSDELRATFDELLPSAWYPRQCQAELLGALAEAKGRGETAYGDLMRCGAAMTTMENPFAKLLMQVLTPELFVKKLPAFWERDHRNSGGMTIELLEQGRARLRLTEVAGYHHGPVMWLGWMRRVLEVLSGPRSEVSQTGWSWSTPAPDEVAYEVRWS